VRSSFTKSGNAFEDYVGGLGPDERFGIFVVGVKG
jgi:hypothetical protein